MKPLVSVIIPTLNRHDLLLRALASVYAQDYPALEVIVVDDGSTTPINLETIRTRAGSIPVTLLRNEHTMGVSVSRNRGVAASKGYYIAFLDSDDEWFFNKTSRQVTWMEENPEFKISQTKENWNRNGTIVSIPKGYRKIHGSIFNESLLRCMVTPSSVLIQRDFFLALGGFNEALYACEDYDLWLRITAHYPVGLVDEFLMTRYGGHADQLSATAGVMDRWRIRALLDLIATLDKGGIQWHSAVAVLIEKARIVAQGAIKRGKHDEGEQYMRLAQKYSEERDSI